MAEQKKNDAATVSNPTSDLVQVAEAPEQAQTGKPVRLGPPNLCAKYNISRDDYYASVERLVKYILDTYNFGSELVTIMVLDQLRNGDIPEEKESGNKQVGIYRR